jgi:hypothetical protein
MPLCLVPRRLALVAVIGHVCGLCFYMDYSPYVAPMAWTTSTATIHGILFPVISYLTVGHDPYSMTCYIRLCLRDTTENSQKVSQMNKEGTKLQNFHLTHT